VQIYTPLDLVAATVDGHAPSATGLRSLGRSGNWAHELDVAVPPKSSTIIELRLAGHLAGPPGEWTLDVSQQPAVHPDDVTVTLDLADGWTIGETIGECFGQGSSASAKLTLDRDAHLGAEMRRR